MGPRASRHSHRWLAIILTAALLITMFMGVGPGLRLVNPSPDRPGSAFTVFGLPTIYAWGLLWYLAQLLIIVVASVTLWRTEGDEKDD
jgi:hypothetical protein